MLAVNKKVGALACLYIGLLIIAASVEAQDRNQIEDRVQFSETQLLNREIRVLTPAGGSTRLTPQNVSSVLGSDAIIAERIEVRDIPLAGTDGEWSLPFQYSTASGDTFRPQLVVISPIAFDNEFNTFKGRLGLGVLSQTDAAASGRLPQPVHFTIAGDADSIEPTQVAVTHLNQPFSEIEVSVREPDEELALNVFASFDPEPEPLKVPTKRPQLDLSISPASIDGLGLAMADVNVSAHRDYAGRTVTLSYGKGRIGESVLTLGQDGKAQTQIRSQFVGDATLSVGGYPFEAARGSVEYVLPLVFIISGIAGALGGALVRKVMKKEDGKQFFVAIFSGFLGALLAALGVNFINLPVAIPAGETFAFVFAAISAYMGAAVFTSSSSAKA